MLKDRNKIIKNIYYMLSYAFQNLHTSIAEKIEKEEFDNIHNLFAAILEKGIGLQLKQGLYREYVNCSDNLSVMRGKIDIQATIKDKIEKKALIGCNFDELSENNLFNQILKETVSILLKCSDVKAEYKNSLKKEMLFFSNISKINLTEVKWGNLRFQRNNQNYRMLISICQLIVEGMLITNENGIYKLASFIDDQRMEGLYEKFLLEYYRQEYAEQLSANASEIPWDIDKEGYTYLPKMKSDVTITKGNKILIIDAKYYTHIMQKNYDKATICSGNLYQIFAYVKNKEYSFKDKGFLVSGLLLYAKTEDDIQPDEVYTINGNKIGVETLDLNKDFSDIRAQLDRVLENYFE